MNIESVFVAIPTHTGCIRCEIAEALTEWARTPNVPPPRERAYTVGCSVVSEARDILAGEFLKSGATHVLWIDDDMAPTFGHIARLMTVAQKHQLPFVSGQCFKKVLRSTLAWAPTGGRLPSASWLIEAEWAGMAFALIAREVFQGLTSRCQTYKHDAGGGLVFDVTGFFFPEHPGVNEDVAFCRRVRDEGFKIWVDVANTIPHIGWCRYPVTEHGEKLFTPGVEVIPEYISPGPTPPEPAGRQEQPSPGTPVTSSKPYPGSARNAPCPCGSGKKYKKCCGA